MRIKKIHGVIACVQLKNEDYLFSPGYEAYVFNDSIAWENVSGDVVRLSDNSLVFDTDPRVFADSKMRKLEALKASFDERISGTIDAHDYRMQFDISDSLKMQGAIQLLETTGATEGYLTLANDETVYHVPLEVMKAVLVDMLSAYAACHARKQELRAAINAAETIDALDAIEIAWPL